MQVDKEDLFVDAADDLSVSADSSEAVTPAAVEDGPFKEKDDGSGGQLVEMDEAVGNGPAENELERLQSILEKTVLENETIKRELKV